MTLPPYAVEDLVHVVTGPNRGSLGRVLDVAVLPKSIMCLVRIQGRTAPCWLSVSEILPGVTGCESLN